MFASDKLLKLLYPDYHLSPEEYLIFNISILDTRRQNPDQYDEEDIL